MAACETCVNLCYVCWRGLGFLVYDCFLWFFFVAEERGRMMSIYGMAVAVRRWWVFKELLFILTVGNYVLQYFLLIVLLGVLFMVVLCYVLLPSCCSEAWNSALKNSSTTGWGPGVAMNTKMRAELSDNGNLWARFCVQIYEAFQTSFRLLTLVFTEYIGPSSPKLKAHCPWSIHERHLKNLRSPQIKKNLR